MPYYSKLGQMPRKRHTQFRRPDGALYSEEVFGTEGFVGPTSTLYHIHPPTQVTGWKTMYGTKPGSRLLANGTSSTSSIGTNVWSCTWGTPAESSSSIQWWSSDRS